MSRSRQTLLGRLTFSGLVAAALTFGGAQALAGSSPTAACSSGYTCATRPQDSGCAARCLQLYPLNGGAHFCSGLQPGGGYCCVCAE